MFSTLREAVMPQYAPCSQAQIKAVFGESTLHFEVPPETLLEELCALLSTLGRGHGELVIVEESVLSITGDNFVL